MPWENNIFHDRFDWYAWSAPVHEGAEAILKALSVQDFRKKRLKGLRVVGAVLNMTGAFLRGYEERLGRDAGLGGVSSGGSACRGVIPHSVTLCEPFMLDFDDGTVLDFLPGEGVSARIGRNSIPPSCTEGLNRPNFRPERLFTPYLAGRSLQRILVQEESSVLRQYEYSGGRVESSRREGSLVRYVFCFSRHAKLTATSDGSGRYELALCREEGGQELPYLKFRAASLMVEQPLLCHGGSGEEPYFLVYAEGPSGLSQPPSFSMDEEVLEDYLLPFLERRFEPELNAREAWEPKGFDGYGCNHYGKGAVREMLSDVRAAVSALRAGEDTPLRKRLLEKRRRQDVPYRTQAEACTASEDAFLAGAVNFYERFLTRMEGLLKAMPEQGRIVFLGA